MPSITHDGRSFMLDGRRIWIVAGALDYTRIPREQWADRIHAARLAGLNTIAARVFWNRHEPVAGRFDFDGENDLRHFIQLIDDAGLHCILRPGPYVGGGWDFGGLPNWLRTVKDIDFRTANGPFLEACSRYITAVADQVRDLQVTSPGKGGPILLVQNEAGWTCGDDLVAARYLGELHRYLRESGLHVPIVNANNLWAGAEGEIDAWTGSAGFLAIMRQLTEVNPDNPRLVIDFTIARRRTFGDEGDPTPPAHAIQRRLGEVLAGGGQYMIEPFHGGTSFGFYAGRLALAPASFATPTDLDRSVLQDAGDPGASYAMVRRISTFASRFARVLANLDPEYRPVMSAPARIERTPSKSRRFFVAHCAGSQGDVVFIFADDPPARAKNASASLLLPTGMELDVPVGSQGVVWCLVDVLLAGRARLDYTNLCAFAAVGSLFVCFGPAGASGVVSINGSPMEATVPKGVKPVIAEHEGVHVIVLSEDQVDRTFITEQGVVIGADSVNARGEPIAASGGTCTLVTLQGAVSTIPAAGRAVLTAAQARVALDEWEGAPCTEYTEGTSPRYASIVGPADLTSLGASQGYGWYRLAFSSAGGRRVKVMAPQSADRLLMMQDGDPVGVLGVGPGAEDTLTLQLRKDDHVLTILADNMGRYSEGNQLGEQKGLFGEIWEVKALRAGKAKVEVEAPLDILAFRSPIWGVARGDFTTPERLTWKVIHRRQTPIIMCIEPMELCAILLLNGEPVRFIDHGEKHQVFFDKDALRRGNNVFQLAPQRSSDALAELARHVSFVEGAAALKAQWAFAKWELAPPSAYKVQPKSGLKRVPTWWRSGFTPAATENPLRIELAGLTKGQVFVNKRHLGRYWVSTPERRQVGPQMGFVIPPSWITPDEYNELIIFDEHGANPSRVKMAYDAQDAVLRA